MGPSVWLAMARDELRAAELLAEHDLAPLSCLHADQAIEKALQALHVYRTDGDGEAEDGGWLLLSELDPPSGRPHPRLAAALASLARRTARARQGERAETESAQEAVQIAQQLVERVAERVYGET